MKKAILTIADIGNVLIYWGRLILRNDPRIVWWKRWTISILTIVTLLGVWYAGYHNNIW